MTYDFDSIKLFVEIIVLLAGAFMGGYLVLLKNVISGQKDYIDTLERKKKLLDDDYQKEVRINATMNHELKQLHTRIDDLSKIPLHSLAGDIHHILTIIKDKQ